MPGIDREFVCIRATVEIGLGLTCHKKVIHLDLATKHTSMAMTHSLQNDVRGLTEQKENSSLITKAGDSDMEERNQQEAIHYITLHYITLHYITSHQNMWHKHNTLFCLQQNLTHPAVTTMLYLQAVTP